MRLEGDRLAAVPGLSTPIVRLLTIQDALWAVTNEGLYRYRDSIWQQISKERVTDVTEHLGQAIASSERRLWRIEDDSLTPLVDAESPFPITRIISHCETLYVHGPGRLTYFAGDRIGDVNVYGWPSDKA